jgi:4a-hydroxytetrahydrobiopterin dehydratase
MADLLDSATIDDALSALPGWRHDDGKLVKRAQVPLDSQDALVDTVARVADELDHHPDVSRDGDTVVFRLWTHSAGGVTRKDVDLASRIDQALSGAGRDTGTT